jgi:hypothetical protein
MTLTTDPNHPDLGHGGDTKPVPQNKAYLILSAEERAKGFVRPVRCGYVHIGIEGPKYPLRDLTDEERERYAKFGYIKYEKYPEPNPDGSSVVGSFWTQERLDKVGKGCRTLTTMARELGETYARNPRFYGSTYCCGCSMHLPVAEFVWDGSEERVGS